MSENQRVALYTVLMGTYERLNELSQIEPGVDAYCFTNRADLVSETWKVIQVAPKFSKDLVRSQRLLKIQGHPVLNGHSVWLYKDNSVTLSGSAQELTNRLLGDSDLGMPLHSFRNSIHEEFEAVLHLSLDKPKTLFKQLIHYSSHAPKLLESKPLWTALIARRNTSEVEAWAAEWASHVSAFSRRDQLSVRFAQNATDVHINEIELDNFKSQFHTWPENLGRAPRKPHWAPSLPLRHPAVADLRQRVSAAKEPLLKRIPAAIKRRLRPGSKN